MRKLALSRPQHDPCVLMHCRALCHSSICAWAHISPYMCTELHLMGKSRYLCRVMHRLL